MKARRKAIDCKLIRESKDHPGYFKYQVTIQETDGSTHVVPAYGKDMQDAISRLVWTERRDAITRKKVATPMLIAGWITTIVVPSIIAAITDDPRWVLGAIGLSILLALVAVRVDKYFNKD
jgi:hypothetical protein